MNSQDLEKYTKLIHKHTELMMEYEKILVKLSQEGAESEILPYLFPFTSPVIIERKCALDNENSGLRQLLVKSGERNLGIKELRDFTKGSKSLIIVDPYFFSGQKTYASNLADDVEKCCRASSKLLKRVHVIYDPKNVTNAVKNAIKKMFNKNKICFILSETDKVHDRVWISDRKRALVVGTSLNGIGSRATFLLSLPESDLNAVLEFLDRNYSVKKIEKST